MKILRSIQTLNPAIGGPIESVRQSSLALSRAGHEVLILTLDDPTAPWLKDVQVNVHTFGPAPSGYGHAPDLLDWIRKHHAEFDAVLVHGVWQYLGYSAWKALHGTATPYFVFPHGMLDPWFRRNYPGKHLKKLLYWIAVEHRVLRDATAVLFTSEEERRLARQSFRPYHVTERVVNYGTAAPDIDLSQARERFFNRFPNLRNARVFLFLGRLHGKKGCDLLIRAFADVIRSEKADRPLHLVMAGPPTSPAYLEELKHLVETSMGENAPVTFAGMLSGQTKWEAFAAAEVFVLPSHQENFGIAVAEALACGTPVLISQKVNIWREIVDDGAGLAEPDTVEGTKHLLQRWLGLSEAERAAMCKRAAACFMARFQIERAASSLISVLSEFVRAR